MCLIHSYVHLSPRETHCLLLTVENRDIQCTYAVKNLQHSLEYALKVMKKSPKFVVFGRYISIDFLKCTLLTIETSHENFKIQNSLEKFAHFFTDCLVIS